MSESSFARTNSIEFVNKVRERGRKKRIKAVGHDLYRSLIASEEELDKEENKGKRYNISGDLKCHIDELKQAIEIIKSKGGLFSNYISKTDFFIVYDDKNKEDILNKLEIPFTGEIITLSEFVSTNNKQ